MPPPSLRSAKGNRILAALPKATLDRLVDSLDLQQLPMRHSLQQRGKPIEHVVFPLTGVASMVSMGDAGESVEVATIGSEGMVGLPLFLGGESASVDVFMQVPGEGLVMEAAAFREQVENEHPLSRALLLYTQALLTQIAQCSACNQHHTMVGRCARWLLQTHDRVKGDKFPLTHEFLGLMLGVRRATVTETAQKLQNRGLIRYVRGTITVLDREGLQKAACICYRLIDAEYTRLTAAMKRLAPY
jgi:CRP-like cAMP-binding protein